MKHLLLNKNPDGTWYASTDDFEMNFFESNHANKLMEALESTIATAKKKFNKKDFISVKFENGNMTLNEVEQPLQPTKKSR